MFETSSPFPRPGPSPVAVDGTASRALDGAAAVAAEAHRAAARALDVDWVARAARAYDGRTQEALGAVDDAVSMLGAAAASARRAEQQGREDEPPSCLTGATGGR